MMLPVHHDTRHDTSMPVVIGACVYTLTFQGKSEKLARRVA